MYDNFDDHFERHFDYSAFMNAGEYNAYMSGEDGVEGSLPMDCEGGTGQLNTSLFFLDDCWEGDDVSDFLTD